MELYPESHLERREYLLFPMTNKVLGAGPDQQQLPRASSKPPTPRAGGTSTNDLHRSRREIARAIHVS